MSWLWLMLGLGVVALAGSARLRKAIVNQVLFPAGYFLYTTKAAGYTLHKNAWMSSAAKPATPHSKIDAVRTYGEGDSAVQVVPVPLLDDNYCYLLLHAKSKTAALVDPADPFPVTEQLKQHAEYKLTHILTTHKHWDHAGGNLELAKQFSGLTIVGGVGDGVAGATKECTTGDVVQIADGFAANVYQCPCHTKGHILYGVANTLFTGDTLFAGGCGKFFEGNAGQMYKNLYETIGSLPDSTYVFPGHEYTVSNLEFAAWVEPENSAVKEKLAWSQERRAGKFPTIPTTLQEEKAYNPFMRVHQPAVVSRVSRVLGLSGATSGSDTDRGVRVLDALRTLKNENAHKK